MLNGPTLPEPFAKLLSALVRGLVDQNQFDSARELIATTREACDIGTALINEVTRGTRHS